MTALAFSLGGQTLPQQRPVAWSRVGNTALAEGLAGLAGGRVLAVWYSSDGRRLLARTESGRVFQTADLEHWQLNQSEIPPAKPLSGPQIRQFRLGGANLYVSDNSGNTWINLTGLNDISVVGGGADALASNPGSPQEIAIANARGIWRSADGGLTWSGLNEHLPNFPASKLLGQRSVLLKDGTAASWTSGAWVPAVPPAAEAVLKQKATSKFGVEISALVQKDAAVYAGTVDGRVFVSRANGDSWLETPRLTNAPVQRIWLDPDRTDVGLAIAGNKLFRTINGGVFWDEVTGSMPPLNLNAVTADRSASVIYAATDRGVYTAALSLNDAGAPSGAWTSVSGELPASPALDILYNLDGTLTVALDGYGVFESVAPHRSRGIKLLSGADLTERAAAPGSLVSVMGAKLLSARSGELSYPLVLSSEASTQLQVPFESSTGILTLALSAGAENWFLPLMVKESAPAIFVDSNGAPLITDSETGLVVDPKSALHAGERVQVMATGLGKVTPEWPSGRPAPAEGAPVVRGVVNAFLDGVPLEVSRAALAAGYVGYYTVELQLPSIVNRGVSELTIVMNGERSNRVKVFLEPLALQ